MSANLLIIDSNLEATESYQKALAPKAASWTVHYAASADEGLKLAEAHTPDIIVTALSLNDGQGLKVLSQAIDAAPLAHAFIAAEESDRPQLAAAFEGGCRYLPSPCPSDRLLLEFQRCLAIDAWLESPVIKEIVSSRSEFESLPAHHHQIVTALNAPHSAIDEVAEAIANDLALSAKVLETANSSFYGFDENVADIKQAISLLGLSNTRNIVLATHVFSKVGQDSEHQSLIKEIWHHSIAVAGAARRICLHETNNHCAAEEAYSAGLLHDIGKIVLLGVVPDEYIEAQRLSREESLSAWQTEYKVLGCDHAEVGAYLLAKWGLPSTVSEAAALHHRPANSCHGTFSTLAAVHAANAIVRKRRNPKHADATPITNFLIEIGKSQQWADWEAIAKGEKPPSQKKLKMKPRAAPQEEAPRPQVTTTKEAHDALSRRLEKEDQKKNGPSPHPRGQNTTLAFAAGIICCLCCIYFLSTIKDAPAQERAQTVNVSPEEKLDSIGSREDILEEILGANDPAEAPLPEPAIDSIEQAIVVEPPPPPPPPFPEIKLGAIFQQTSGAKAQVNGRILSVGETIEGAKITAIHRTSIEVVHYDRLRTITLD